MAAAAGDDAGSDSSVIDAENGWPEKSRWVYVCHRDATGDLFARYRRRHPRLTKVIQASAATGSGRGQTADGSPHGQRACPRCNGWVYRIPRRFVDGLLNILAPVHRYRCRSVTCGWEGNLRVRRDTLPSLRQR
ncbi:hypothetical protein [Accumulibacter sp.]|uniref:hypothetical protein n=1 Tax=Accumulibacter sp. TaxID=2053492 RepID=UPI001A422108|nr:hypothetical protein [Accumulibacter sp.]MBL8375406.1 hypothetical protein [Accumulibacter sp.]